MTFHIGQTVVCVNDSGLHNDPVLVARPFKGCVYRVRGFVHECNNKSALYLCEVVNCLCPEMCVCGFPDPEEYGFFDWRFRPVKDTSIDVFTSMLSAIPREMEKVQ